MLKLGLMLGVRSGLGLGLDIGLGVGLGVGLVFKVRDPSFAQCHRPIAHIARSCLTYTHGRPRYAHGRPYGRVRI